MAKALLAWYARHRRDLPWRTPLGGKVPPDPWAVLVSEFMLQQTQVATVIPYFLRFMHAFPSIHALAGASDQKVLRLWQGLGYYSRARNLHATAKKIEADFAGQIPSSLDVLRSLPGIGRYTAGAIASIGFEQRAPIVDGNVARVLCRLEKIKTDPRAPKTQKKLWQLAEQILPSRQLGNFNSAMMELGATLCTPRNPRCTACPLKHFCLAAKSGIQQSIPPARKTRPIPLNSRWTICILHNDRWLIERRPDKGRWAGLWQFPTIQALPANPTAKIISQSIRVPITSLKEIGQVHHTLTHRRYVFNVFRAVTNKKPRAKNETRHWVRPEDLDRYPLSRPQTKIAEIIISPRLKQSSGGNSPQAAPEPAKY